VAPSEPLEGRSQPCVRARDVRGTFKVVTDRDDNDAHFFESIPVEITHRVFSDETKFTERTKDFDINAASFQEKVVAAQEASDRMAPDCHCVVTMRGNADATFTKREHFVPEGLGFDWTAPGVGVGTCDEVNERFGKYECEWLRQGTMGIFRPFFVPEGKDTPPAYYAPNKKEQVFSFTREKDGKRTLNVFGDVNLPDRSGPGEIEIRVPHNEARTEWVSLAIHKMALLMFWLCEGPLAFDAAFADLRRFLIEPGQANFRGYVESMVPGASPGVELHYLVAWRPLGDGKAQIETVHCAVRAHHMKYILVLAGQQDPVPEGLSWKTWVDPKLKVPEHTTFAFGMSGLARADTPL